MLPDTVFIVTGALPIVDASVWGLFHLRRLRAPVAVEPEREQEEQQLVNV